MCAVAPVSRYQSEVLPDEEGPAVALCSAACRDAMSRGWAGAAAAPGAAPYGGEAAKPG